jgi:serine/threonine protein phosphatase PrpC
MSEPEIKIHEILQNDKFFICGTSSLWESLGPDEVIEIVNDHGIKDDDCSSDVIFSKLREVNDG